MQDRVVGGVSFLTKNALCTLHIVDLWRYYGCPTRSCVTECTLTRRYNASLRSRTSQYSMTFVPFSITLWNGLVDPVLDGVGLAGFKSRANALLLA